MERFLNATALAVVVTMAGTAPAFAAAPAQSDTATPTTNVTTPTTSVDCPAGTASCPSDEKDVVIVGSRLRRSEFNTPEPVTIITRDEATLQGFNSTTDLLQSTAVTTGAAQINNAFGGYVTNGGPGANTLSLRGLGASRTLILLDGRRIAPAGSRGSVGSADLNVLPTAMIERVEILKSGASSVYGSDAVAGVVNIVTRSKVNGITLEGQHDITQEGGGNSQRYSAVFGYNTDRLHLAGSLEVLSRGELTVGDRDWTQCQTDYRMTATNRTPGSGDFIDPQTGRPKCYPITGTGDNGVTINTIGTSTVAAKPAAGAVTTTFNRLRPNAAVTTGVVGYEGVGGGTNNLNVRDTFDPRYYNVSLISPTKTYTGYLKGSYNIGILGDAEIYGDLLVNRRKSSQNGFRQFTIDYLKGSPLIPANLQFSSVGAAGFSTANPTSAIGVRAFTAFGNYGNRQTVDFVKAAGGIRGDITFLKDWRYDLYVSKSWSDSTYTSDLILSDRLGNSLNVVSNGAGGFNCVNQAGGCVAAPSLTPAVVGGQFPQAWLNYVVQPVTGHTAFRETTANFAFNGPLFRLPGGDVQLALGGEYRDSSINDVPGNDSVRGNLYGFTSSGITRGSDTVKELFGEIEVPILRRVPFFYDLTLNASGRYTDYRSYGSQETYKVAGTWSPIKALTFRGGYGTSYRAPALFEQFLGATTGFVSQTADPCYNYGAAGVSANRVKNCASEGLAGDFTQTNSVTVVSGGGAASGLSAETSTNLTAGVIVQPNLGKLGSISLAADYFRIEVKNGVEQIGYSNILPLCYDDPNFRAGSSYCRLVTRDPTTKALTVLDNYINLSQDIVRGIDFTARYSVNLFSNVQFRLDAQATDYLEQSNRLFADDGKTDYNGQINTPKWTGSFDASIATDKVTLHYGLEWIQGTDSYDYLEEDPATSAYVFKVPDYFLHSVSAQFRVAKDYAMTVGVRNLFNTEPPQISSGYYNRVGNAPLYSGYDYFGRTFFVNVSAHF